MNTLVPLEASPSDTRPLPLIVAEKWGFKLTYLEKEAVYWFSVIDWICGLLETDIRNASNIWSDIQRRGLMYLSDSIQTMPYIRADGREYQADYTTDKGLYVIAQEPSRN